MFQVCPPAQRLAVQLECEGRVLQPAAVQVAPASRGRVPATRVLHCAMPGQLTQLHWVAAQHRQLKWHLHT